jgi:uncharacterized phage-associated protein
MTEVQPYAARVIHRPETVRSGFLSLRQNVIGSERNSGGARPEAAVTEVPSHAIPTNCGHERTSGRAGRQGGLPSKGRSDSSTRGNRRAARHSVRLAAMPYDCRAVANAILDLADEFGLRLTHMAVHKIAYYAHGWHLARTETPLIRQEFEAWRDGPVQRLVWDCFKAAGGSPIRGRATRFDLVSRTATEVREEIAESDLRLLRDIVVGYGHLHAFELSEMTHEKGGPWDRVWNAPGGRVTLGMRIEHAAIREHFISRAGAAGAAS